MVTRDRLRTIESGDVRADEQIAAFSDLVRTAPSGAVEAAIKILKVAANSPSKGAFVTRSLHALTRLAEVSTRRSLLEAAGAASDTMVLLEALDQPDVLAEMGEDNPLIEAQIRGALAQRHLLDAEGGLRSAEEMGQLLGGLSRQAIDNRRKRGKLIALNLGRHGYGYPAWQAHEGVALPGLEGVLRVLCESDPWAQFGFMLAPNSWLDGETPLAELRRGEIERVTATAEMFAG